MYYLKELLINTIEMGGSDLHLTLWIPPTVRKNGKLVKLWLENLLQDDIERFVKEILESKYEGYLENGEYDISYSVNEIGRFRANVFKQRNSHAIAIRVIGVNIPRLQELKHSSVLKDIADKKRGLILVTGPTGSGKLIREGKTEQIESAVQTGSKDGMRTMDMALADLYKKGEITAESVLSNWVDKEVSKGLWCFRL